MGKPRLKLSFPRAHPDSLPIATLIQALERIERVLRSTEDAISEGDGHGWSARQLLVGSAAVAVVRTHDEDEVANREIRAAHRMLTVIPGGAQPDLEAHLEELSEFAMPLGGLFVSADLAGGEKLPRIRLAVPAAATGITQRFQRTVHGRVVGLSLGKGGGYRVEIKPRRGTRFEVPAETEELGKLAYRWLGKEVRARITYERRPGRATRPQSLFALKRYDSMSLERFVEGIRPNVREIGEG